MTRDEAVTVVSMIVNSWPGPEWDVERLAAYVDNLMPLDAAITTIAVSKAVRQLKYRPSIAELREYVRLVEREQIADGELISYMPVEKVPKPAWVLRWERARAAGDFRPFPEQVHALNALSRVDAAHFAAYAPPNSPIDDREAWCQPDEYLEGPGLSVSGGIGKTVE